MTASTAEKTDTDTDLEAILPPPGEVEIAGIACKVNRLKFREFASLMSILTGAFGSGVDFASITAKNQDEMAGELVGLLVVAIPHQVDPFLTLVRQITRAVDEAEQPRLNEYLKNPEVEDVLPVIDAVIDNEKDNLWSLSGKARAYLSRWKTVVRTAKPGR